ncbi:MAG TPA: rhomboid family intramembrane serine protease [Verrucomicrobiae bacterium]|nr:rhomboid family intramembrane serine protease [Verrucomicrobiae bacterium]
MARQEYVGAAGARGTVLVWNGMIPLKDDIKARSAPVVTAGLIFANVLVFAYQLSLPLHREQEIALRFGLVPGFVTGAVPHPPGGEALTLASFFTSMFLHGDLLHIAGNMLFLWIFGNNVEDAMGKGRFLVFYLTCGLAAATAQILALPRSTLPMIGASGAIAGVLGAYFLLFPQARILTLVPFIFVYFVRLPAFVVLGVWFVLQVTSSLAGGRSGVAWSAHVGGFVAGMVLLGLFLPRRRRSPPPAEGDWI